MVDGRNHVDLATLDRQGFDTWQANPNSRRGDLILMYRTAPFSDIAYAFLALGNPQPARRGSVFKGKLAIDLAGGYRFQRVLSLDNLRQLPSLKHWSFLRNQQGVMNHRTDLQELGVWRPLRKVIEEHAPGIAGHFGSIWKGLGATPPVFMSFSSEDLKKVQLLYQRLAAHGLEIWLDRVELAPGVQFKTEIDQQIAASRAMVICVSRAWNRNRRFAKIELATALEIAKQRSKFIFPVMLENCNLNEPLDAFQRVDVYGRAALRQLDRLAAQLRHFST